MKKLARNPNSERNRRNGKIVKIGEKWQFCLILPVETGEITVYTKNQSCRKVGIFLKNHVEKTSISCALIFVLVLITGLFSICL